MQACCHTTARCSLTFMSIPNFTAALVFCERARGRKGPTARWDAGVTVHGTSSSRAELVKSKFINHKNELFSKPGEYSRVGDGTQRISQRMHQPLTCPSIKGAATTFMFLQPLPTTIHISKVTWLPSHTWKPPHLLVIVQTAGLQTDQGRRGRRGEFPRSLD